MFIICIEDIEEALNKKDKSDSRNIVSKEYHEFLNVFLLKKTEKLLLHCDYNHEIVLKKEKKLFFESLYFMSYNKFIMLKNWLKKNLQKKFIHLSFSSAASSVLFIKKFKEELCFCVNYCCGVSWLVKVDIFIFLNS